MKINNLLSLSATVLFSVQLGSIVYAKPISIENDLANPIVRGQGGFNRRLSGVVVDPVFRGRLKVTHIKDKRSLLDDELASLAQNANSDTSVSTAASPDHINDETVDSILREIKPETQWHRDDNDEPQWYAMLSEVDAYVESDNQGKKTTATNVDDEKMEQIVKESIAALQQPKQQQGITSSHQDDAKMQEIVNEAIGYLKQSGSTPEHSNDATPQATVPSFGTLGDDQHLNELQQAVNDAIGNLKSIGGKSLSSDKSAVGDKSFSAKKLPSFDEYIKSLDQDYRVYIEKNKDTLDTAVTHKNSADDYSAAWKATDDEAAKYFTNDDQRTQLNQHLNADLDALAASEKYFTNDDQRTHANDQWNTDLDEFPSNAEAPEEYIANDDQRTGVNDHLNADLDELAGSAKASEEKQTGSPAVGYEAGWFFH